MDLSSLPRGAYVFDKDGTLLDTESLWIETLREVMAVHGQPYDLALHAKIMGGGIGPAARRFQQTFPDLPQGEAAADALEREMWERYREMKKSPGVQLHSGAHAFLSACHDVGIPLALATSSPRWDLEEDLDRLRLRPFFRVTVAGDEVSRLKPAPDMYLEAARQLGVPPSQCTAFEDADNGIRSAHEAGMQVVFLRDPRFNVMPPPGVALTIRGFTELVSG